jgi:hypothetical protein
LSKRTYRHDTLKLNARKAIGEPYPITDPLSPRRVRLAAPPYTFVARNGAAAKTMTTALTDCDI